MEIEEEREERKIERERRIERVEKKTELRFVQIYDFK
jgi:hypothetical protein